MDVYRPAGFSVVEDQKRSPWIIRDIFGSDTRLLKDNFYSDRILARDSAHTASRPLCMGHVSMYICMFIHV